MDVCQSESEDLLSNDPGLWPAKLMDSDRTGIVRKLATTESKLFPKDSERKAFPEYKKAANGREKTKRDWLIYSESVNAQFCIPCVLFAKVHWMDVDTKCVMSNGATCITNYPAMRTILHTGIGI